MKQHSGQKETAVENTTPIHLIVMCVHVILHNRCFFQDLTIKNVSTSHTVRQVLPELEINVHYNVFSISSLSLLMDAFFCS